MLIDTHEAVEKLLEAGNSKKNAETIVKLINSQDANLATKGDILRLENEFKLLEVKLGKDINWLKGIGMVVIGLLIKIAFFN